MKKYLNRFNKAIIIFFLIGICIIFFLLWKNYIKDSNVATSTGKTTVLTEQNYLEIKKIEGISEIDPEQGLKLANQILSRTSLNTNKQLYAWAVYYRAHCQMNSNPSNSIIKNAFDALNLASEIKNDSLKALTNNLIGRYYLWKSEYTDALKHFNLSLVYFEKKNDKTKTGSIYNNLGLLYFELDRYDKSIDYYNKSERIFENVGDVKRKAIIQLNMANLYEAKGNFNEAEIYSKKSSHTFELLNDTVSWVSNLINQSRFKQSLAQNDSALIIVDMAETLLSKKQNDWLLERIIFNKGMIYKKMKDYEKAEYFFMKSERISNRLQYPKGRMEAYQALSEIKQINKKWQESLVYYHAYDALKDSLYNSGIQQILDDLKWKNDFQKIHYEKDLLKSKYEISHQQNRNLRLIFFSILVIILSVVGYTITLYNSKRKTLKIKELENAHLAERIKVEEGLKKIKQQNHQLEVETKNREITAISLQLIAKNKALAKMRNIIQKAGNEDNVNNKLLRELERNISNSLNEEKDWLKFKEVFEKVHPDFFETIKQNFPELSKTEIRVCVFIKISMTNNEISKMLNISQTSVIKCRYRIRKKLQLDSSENLDEFIKSQ